MIVLGWALIGYAAGSVPSAWLVARATGRRNVLEWVDRNTGEADAHLMLRRSGGRAATVAAVMDVVKALVPVVAASQMVDPYAVAGCAVGTVVGHCWPPVAFRYAGRGLAAAAGAFLGFLPLEMVAAGLVRVLAVPLRAGGLLSTLGFAGIPVLAVLRGQPVPFVVAAVAMNLLIFARRLEGVHDDLMLGVPAVRAVMRRVLLDASSARRPG